MICPICGSPAAGTFQARYVRAAKCGSGSCGHIWAVGVAPGAGVQRIEDPDASGDAYVARNADLCRFLKRRGFLFDGARVLDVGAGSGHLTVCYRGAGRAIEVVAVEAEPALRSRLSELGFESHGDLAAVGGLFDSIALVEVIEHLDDPVSVLALLRSRLKPGGLLFCTTPCGETRVGSRATNAYDTPEHVQFFTERSLGLAFARAGFSNFRRETINAMTSALTPPPARWLKDVLRPLRAALLGPVHLTGFARG